MRRALMLAFVLVGSPAIAAEPLTLEQMLIESTESFARMDLNGDGQIDRVELDKAVRRDFARLDVNKDGVIDEKDDPGLVSAKTASAPAVETPPGTAPIEFEGPHAATVPLLDDKTPYTPRQDH